MPAEFVEYQAPVGTYDTLATIADGRLGNQRTKRFIDIKRWPVEDPSLRFNPPLVVSLDIRQRRGEHVWHLFEIDPSEKIVIAGSYRFQPDEDLQRPDESPSLNFLLQEIRAAQRVQPTLSR